MATAKLGRSGVGLTNCVLQIRSRIYAHCRRPGAMNSGEINGGI